MNYSYGNALLWLGIYLALSLIPLAMALLGDVPAFRSFWIEFGVALGFIGLGMFALQFIFSGRIIQIAPSFGMDNIYHFHMKIGIVSFIFVLAHPVTLILSDSDFLSYFDPRVNFMRAIALSFATISLFLITASSLWRLVFKLSYEQWRLLHGFLGLTLVFIGTVHAIQVGHYMNELWKQIALAVLMGISMYWLIHTRIVRPWKNRKKPYKITDVIEERDDCWTLEIEAVNRKRMRFKCGQFAWLTINDSPFSLQQHPFTIASSTVNEKLLFTAKESGDFTSTWGKINKGSTVFLEGPFGSFVPAKDKHLFLVMGGIGVTPAMSMLRSMRDTNDKRKAILIYGSNKWEDVTFREELEEMKNQIDLKLVHILMEPHDDWKGEKGKVDEAFLKKYLPKKPHDFMYFICGPEPMMDITEISLRDLGVDWRYIYTERFKIV